MDFRQTSQPSTSRPVAPAAPATPVEHKPEKVTGGKRNKSTQWLRIFNAVILVGVAILLVGIALVINRGNATTNEFKYVTTSKYQAVFLNNGQVYFGKITNLNNDYVRLSNIYYLTQSSDSTSTASSNYSLVKLGCQQIHDPTDQMVINRSQVTFWENLQDNGKVVTSINQFIKQNPNGPDCSQVSSQTQATSTTTQGTSSTAGTGSSTTK